MGEKGAYRRAITMLGDCARPADQARRIGGRREGRNNVVMQGGLIALHDQQRVTAAVHNGLGDGLLGQQGIRRDNAPFQYQVHQQCGRRAKLALSDGSCHQMQGVFVIGIDRWLMRKAPGTGRGGTSPGRGSLRTANLAGKPAEEEAMCQHQGRTRHIAWCWPGGGTLGDCGGKGKPRTRSRAGPSLPCPWLHVL